MPAVRRNPVTEIFWRMHRSLFRVSGGRIGSRVGPLPVLMLSVRGRKSGVARDVLLNHFRDGEAELLAGGKRLRVRALEADGAERDRLWSEAKRRDDAFAEYEKRTARRIAVVVLEPV